MCYFIEPKIEKLLQSDKDIMMAVRNGEIEKIRLLYTRYKIKLYNYFFRLTFNKEKSEDMVQDLFVKMIKYGHTYKGEGVFTTWMFQIAHNIFKDYLKKKKSHDDIDDHQHKITDENYSKKMVLDDEVDVLNKAFSSLTEADREILTLSRYQNLKYDEIAKIWSCPLGTVKSRAHYAIKNLRSIYFELTNEALL